VVNSNSKLSHYSSRDIWKSTYFFVCVSETFEKYFKI
jgi:hypothetical protein